MLADYWVEFLTIAGVHLIAVASPGPDFAIIVKQVIAYGRKTAIYTSVGIGLGIMLHVIYSILGLGLLIKTTPLLYQGLLYLSAGYLTYIGIKSLLSKPDTTYQLSPASPRSDLDNHVEQTISTSSLVPPSSFKAFRLGFITNGLNPKATLFFLSLFSAIIAPSTPEFVRWSYGVYLSIATGLWFILLSVLLSHSRIDQYLQQYRHVIDRLMGVVLILLALSIVMY
ncbi:MAG: LysE family translocator [Glaciecola sp.]|jgi:threonine/homoserine/homoserine lactone efflux protein